MRYISILSTLLMITVIVVYGLLRKINVYDSFTLGAKEGVSTTFSVIPPLVGLMVAISMFRASGALDILTGILKPLCDFLKIPPAVMPLSLLRPVSGSGSIAIVNDIFRTFGPDSAEGRIASVMMGSTETTFYTVAVYFGAVGIKRIRHTVKAALIADMVGMLTAVYFTYALLIN